MCVCDCLVCFGCVRALLLVDLRLRVLCLYVSVAVSGLRALYGCFSLYCARAFLYRSLAKSVWLALLLFSAYAFVLFRFSLSQYLSLRHSLSVCSLRPIALSLCLPLLLNLGLVPGVDLILSLFLCASMAFPQVGCSWVVFCMCYFIALFIFLYRCCISVRVLLRVAICLVVSMSR